MMTFQARTTLAPQVVRFSVFPPPGTTFPFAGGAPWPAISPDGRQLAFIAVSATGAQHVWVQPLDSTVARVVRGTEGAFRPFWSPDSQSLAYFADGRLWRIDLPEGTPRALAPAPYAGGLKGTWGGDVIAFQAMGGFQRVPASGGAPTVLAKSNPTNSERRRALHHLSFLPDGRRYLFLKDEQSRQHVCVGALDSADERCILEVESQAIYAAPGYLVFVREGVLRAQPFDADRLQLSGEALPVAETQLRIRPTFLVPPFSASNTGVLAYHPGRGETQLLWVDRSGAHVGSVGSLGMHQDVALSADARRLIFSRIGSGQRQHRLVALRSGAQHPRPFHLRPCSRRRWRVLARRRPGRVFDAPAGWLWPAVKAVNGAGPEELVLRSSETMLAKHWSPNGEFVLVQTPRARTGWDLIAVRMTGERTSLSIVESEHAEREGQFSPDTRWVAYDSSDSGRREIWIRRFPPTGEKWQISTTGGFSPRWRGDGRELFYVAADGKLMSVAVRLGAAVDVDTPVPLFQTMFREEANRSYAASADGKRFLINVPPDGRQVTPITVIVNWPRGCAGRATVRVAACRESA